MNFYETELWYVKDGEDLQKGCSCYVIYLLMTESIRIAADKSNVRVVYEGLLVVAKVDQADTSKAPTIYADPGLQAGSSHQGRTFGSKSKSEKKKKDIIRVFLFLIRL